MRSEGWWDRLSHPIDCTACEVAEAVTGSRCPCSAFVFNCPSRFTEVLAYVHAPRSRQLAALPAAVTCVYADRAARRHCHHRDLDRVVIARGAKSPRGGGSHELPEQPETDQPGLAQLPRRHREVPARACQQQP